MATPDDLALGDSGPGADDTLARARQNSLQLLRTIKDILEDPNSHFAYDTLTNMQVYLETGALATPAMHAAVENIYQAARKKHEEKWRAPASHRRFQRRYEGY